jgi:uncharacterized protein (DUF2062 family)
VQNRLDPDRGSLVNRRFEKLKEKLLGIHDSTHRIALGFALGLLLGVIPGTGAIAAVVAAFLIRANKAAALLGALLVNTWINVVTFPLALGIGVFAFHVDPGVLAEDWAALTAHFTWHGFVAVALRKTVLALFVGYLAIGAVLAGIGYGIAFQVIARARKRKDPNGETAC